MLERNVDQVCPAIANVCEPREDQKRKQHLQIESGPEVRPVKYKPNDGYGSKNQVEADAAWFPELNGFINVLSETAR
jgi:hypothetical protein